MKIVHKWWRLVWRFVPRSVSRWTLILRRGFLLLTATVIFSSHAFVQPQQAIEYQVKAAYLFNFLQFIDWPENAFETSSSPFVIGIFDSDPFEGVLAELIRDEKVKGRSIEIREVSTVDDAKHCHILFIPESEFGRLEHGILAFSHTSLLTVGEIHGFTEEGGGINFYLDKNRIRFEINVSALQKASLSPSAKLLKLARVVPSQN